MAFSRLNLKDLIGLAPPPGSPVDTGSPDQWGEVERALGMPLPSDYKQFINVYGDGEFGDFLYVFNPFSGCEQMNLLWQAGVPDSLEKDEELGRVYPLGSHLEHFQQLRGHPRASSNFSLIPFSSAVAGVVG
jgi:hypothetical protein